MLNLQSVVEKFSIISNIEMENCSKWIPICRESLNDIQIKLKETINLQDASISYRIEAAAAALSLYKYALYSGANMAMQSFSAGEIQIKSDNAGAVKIAKRIWQEAKNSISDLLKDENFAFERVSFND